MGGDRLYELYDAEKVKAKGGRRKGGGGMEGKRKEEKRKEREKEEDEEGTLTSWVAVPLRVGTLLCVHTPSPFWLCSAVTHPAQVMRGKTENMTGPPHVPDV